MTTTDQHLAQLKADLDAAKSEWQRANAAFEAAALADDKAAETTTTVERMSVVSMVNAHRAEVVAVPLRIQRQRAKGWRMPKGAVYVGRPGKFGNPFAPRIIPGWATDSRRYAVEDFTRWISHPDMFWRNTSGGFGSAGESVERARALVEGLPSLRGKDLACWCPVGQPCHGDVLLELANA